MDIKARKGSRGRHAILRATVWAALGAGVLWAGLARAQEGTLSQQATALVQEFRVSISGAKVGIAAVDVRTGQMILDVDAATPLVPASNQKLLTSAFAMAWLGKDFHFTTTVWRLGDDILVSGDGDPTLGDPVIAAEEGKTVYTELDRWAAEIKSKVGGRIAGDLVLCSTIPWPAYRHGDWPQAQWTRWYAAPVAGLNFNNNCFDITFAVADGQAMASVQPASRFIKITNQVKLGKKQTWSGRSTEDESALILTGEVARGGNDPVSVACNNPPMLLGRVLADRLALGGVELGGTIRTAEYASVDWSKAQEITQTTTPLAVALQRANKRSLNMAAECLFLRAGNGTWPTSAALLIQTLHDAYGLDTAGLVVRDGGGLSRGNQVSPALMANLLAAVLRRPDADIFVDSLPVSGADGTMQRRLENPPYKRRVLGKTGYIAGVSALSGYVLDEAGKPAIAFSILVNGTPSSQKAHEVQDAVCRMLVDSLGAPTNPKPLP
jgi:D-alanyl-D-alanine carboxypeptidase/D-alanyl-D-alanine-endopeptidase (penicillin-binding protein 4)